MKSKGKPLSLAAEGAGKRSEYSQSTPSAAPCQAQEPFTAKNNLKVDFLLVSAEFIEGVNYVAWN